MSELSDFMDKRNVTEWTAYESDAGVLFEGCNKQ